MTRNFSLKPIDIDQLKKMSSKRLYNHIKSYREYGSSFRCGCSGDYLWNIYPESPQNKTLKVNYKIYKDYIKSIRDIINLRDDFSDVLSDSHKKEKQKIKSGKFRGHQHKTRSKRKKDKLNLK
jgi:hypothetical protein